MTEKNNGFLNEIEKEIENGMDHSEEGNTSFTVTVKDKEYVVKRRYADKDQAKSSAEDLRKTNSNVDDDTDGNFHNSPASDMDEQTDWSEMLKETPDEDEFENDPSALAVSPSPSNKRIVIFPVTVFLIVVALTAFYMFRPDTVQLPLPGNPTDASNVSTGNSISTPVQKQPVPDNTTPETSPEPAWSDTGDAEKPVEEDKDASVDQAETDLTPETTTNQAAKNVAPPQPDTESMAAPPATPVLSFPFTVHISSYKKKANALNEVAMLNKKGLHAFSISVELPNKGHWYRTYSGFFDSLAEAKALTQTISKDFSLDARAINTPYAVQIGDIGSKASLAPTAKALLEKGYTTYYTPAYTNHPGFRLLAGAYETEAGVDSLETRLTEDGFNAKIVRR